LVENVYAHEAEQPDRDEDAHDIDYSVPEQGYFKERILEGLERSLERLWIFKQFCFIECLTLLDKLALVVSVCLYWGLDEIIFAETDVFGVADHGWKVFLFDLFFHFLYSEGLLYAQNIEENSLVFEMGWVAFIVA